MRTILLLTFIIQLCFADNIYLKNGSIIHNVKIIGQRETFGNLVMTFLYNSNGKSIENIVPFNDIARIDPAPYDQSVSSSRSKPQIDSIKTIIATRQDTLRSLFKKFSSGEIGNPEPAQFQQYNNRIKHEYQYPHLNFLFISALSLCIAWDQFATSGNIQDQINNNNNLSDTFHFPIDNSSLESQKTRAIIIGIAASIITIGTAIHGLERIELKSDGESLSLAVNF